MLNKENARKEAKIIRKKLFKIVGRNCISKAILFNFISSIKKNIYLNSVGIYYPIKSETSPLKLIEVCNELDLTITLPIISNRSYYLSFKKWDGNEDLKKSYYGVSEPLCKNKLIIPEIIFVPLLAYDKDLNRLGYGKGYYDKTIQNLREKNFKKNNSFLAVGLAYDEQEVKKVPIESHDQKMDIIITEKKILYKNRVIFL